MVSSVLLAPNEKPFDVPCSRGLLQAARGLAARPSPNLGLLSPYWDDVQHRTLQSGESEETSGLGAQDLQALRSVLHCKRAKLSSIAVFIRIECHYTESQPEPKRPPLSDMKLHTRSPVDVKAHNVYSTINPDSPFQSKIATRIADVPYVTTCKRDVCHITSCHMPLAIDDS